MTGPVRGCPVRELHGARQTKTGDMQVGGKFLRVVSLQPSATEILALIGGAHLLVGRSHECDFPSDLNGVPIVTSSSLTFHSSGQVDTEVGDICVRQDVYLSFTIGIPWLRHPCARCYKLSLDGGTNVNDT